MKMLLTRYLDNGETTLGELKITTEYQPAFEEYNAIHNFFTCEPAWKDNQPNISCIPLGEYTVEPHISPRFGKCLIVKNVAGRSHILFHAGATYLDTKGCILVGLEQGHNIYNRKHNEHNVGILKSKDAKKKLLSLIKKPVPLKIESKITELNEAKI